jgi:hypothetical protein
MLKKIFQDDVRFYSMEETEHENGHHGHDDNYIMNNDNELRDGQVPMIIWPITICPVTGFDIQAQFRGTQASSKNERHKKENTVNRQLRLFLW